MTVLYVPFLLYKVLTDPLRDVTLLGSVNTLNRRNHYPLTKLNAVSRCLRMLRAATVRSVTSRSGSVKTL